LCCLSAYTDSSQFNISFNAPSSSGKSYIPTEIASLFPSKDVREVGYCSPTAFFHDKGQFDEGNKHYVVDLERKVLIFLDQPHTLLLEHLRPLLSHDKKDFNVKITDRNQRSGLRTKNVLIKGFPSVIFCSAGLKIDEQEATRFLLLSPETSQEKIKQGISIALKKETDSNSYYATLNNDHKRQLLKNRIEAIREANIQDIRLHDPVEIEKRFLSERKTLKPRHQRDIKRLASLVKSLALLNLWHREQDDSGVILTSDQDIEDAFRIWNEISYSQELNLPPYVYKLFEEIIVPAYQEKGSGLARRDILHWHLKYYDNPLEDWKLRREILPMLEMAGLITQEQDPQDKRNRLITPIVPPIQSTLSDEETVKLELIKEKFDGKLMKTAPGV